MTRTSFYRAFEDRYRGARDTIKDRLRAYDRFTAPLLEGGLPAVALDLGCGRGEWLELLGERGFDARGVDLDDGMLAACRERGLAATRGDALAALRGQADGSLALVSAFHLVEHLPFELVQDLIAEALRALRPGGLLIMETPNPENLTVGATSFYLDPSHLHPLPPGLLGFAAEHAGFGRQRIVRLQDDPRLRGDAAVGLIDVLEGVSPDYAVVAQKAADAAVLAPFDAAFEAPYGLTLAHLSQHYDAQRAGQHAEIHGILGRLGADASQLARDRAHTHEELVRLRKHARLQHDDVMAQLEQRQVQHQHLADQLDALRRQFEEQGAATARLDARIAHAEAHAAEMSQRVVDLLSSTSWRVTAPLRRVASLAYRLRNAQREGRLGSAARARLKRLARRIGGAVLRRPAAKRAARAVLRHMPSLQARLYRVMMDNSAPAPLVMEPDTGELSPRAARAYRQLKQEQARMADADSH